MIMSIPIRDPLRGRGIIRVGVSGGRPESESCPLSGRVGIVYKGSPGAREIGESGRPGSGKVWGLIRGRSETGEGRKLGVGSLIKSIEVSLDRRLDIRPS